MNDKEERRGGRGREEIHLIPIAEIKEKEEYRSLLPLITEEDYNRLKEDIEKRRGGIQIPLILNEKKELLDGYTRLRIARELGIQHIPCIIKDFANELEEKEFVLTINAHRRHLNTAQKVEVAVKLLEIEREKAKLRQRFKNRKQARRLITSDINISVLPPSEGGTSETYISKEEREGGREEGKEEEEKKKEENEEEEEGEGGEAIRIVAKKLGISHNLLRKGLHIIEAIREEANDNNDNNSVGKYAHIAELWDKALRGEVSLKHVYSELKRKEQHEKLQLLKRINDNNTTNDYGSNGNNNNDINNNNKKKKERKFNVILADPPWQYEFGLRGNAEQHYPCLSLEEIAKVFEEHKEEIAYPCILFLWATAPKLREALQLLDILGFEYKTNMVWVKDRIGTGYYVRNKHELLLIAVKGDIPLPLEDSRPESVIMAERKGEHSRKPDIIYDIIERMYPHCSYLELFAREKSRENWEAYGLDLNNSS